MSKKLQVAQTKSLKEAALEELREERVKEATQQLKRKLKDLQAAKKIVANLQREVDDFLDELDMDESDLA